MTRTVNGQWQIYPDASTFLGACQTLLMSQEALNNMILSSAARYIQNPPKTVPIFAVYKDAAGKTAGALLAAPDKPILTTELAMEATKGLSDLLKDHTRFDVMAPEPAAAMVAQAIETFSGQKMQSVGFQMLLWKKSPVVAVSSGQMRRAWVEDTEPLLKWASDFATTTGVRETSEETAKLLQQMIVNRRLFVWADKGEVAAMAAFTGPTLNGVRINTVYTPPEKRKRGYARSLVLKLTDLQKQLGKSFCVLFTDPLNPTSNKIYLEIGYQPLALFTHYFPAAGVAAPTGAEG